MPDADETPIYYFDSSVFLDLIEHPEDQEPAKTIAAMIDAASKGHCRIITSLITMVEVLWAKHELDKKKLDAKVENRIMALWHPESSPIKVIEVSEFITRDALSLLREGLKKGWSKSKGVDAVHLITAKREGATEFIATEHAMEKWGKRLGFEVKLPHAVAEPEPVKTERPSPLPMPSIDETGLWATKDKQDEETPIRAEAGNVASGRPSGLEGRNAPRPPEEKASGGVAEATGKVEKKAKVSREGLEPS